MVGFAAVALSFMALPGAAQAQYPPQPPNKTISVGAVATICENEAPYITYETATEGFDPSTVAGLTATVTVFDSSGNVVEGPLAGQPLVGRLLYPGASVDSSGKGSDWPGWKFVDGVWVPDSEDAHLRSGLRLQVTVNPTATAPVQYPPESQECMSPPGAASPPSGTPQAAASPSSGSLPSTGGSDPSQILWIALGALVAGGLVSAVSYRRRDTAESGN